MIFDKEPNCFSEVCYVKDVNLFVSSYDRQSFQCFNKIISVKDFSTDLINEFEFFCYDSPPPSPSTERKNAQADSKRKQSKEKHALRSRLDKELTGSPNSLHSQSSPIVSRRPTAPVDPNISPQKTQEKQARTRRSISSHPVTPPSVHNLPSVGVVIQWPTSLVEDPVKGKCKNLYTQLELDRLDIQVAPSGISTVVISEDKSAEYNTSARYQIESERSALVAAWIDRNIRHKLVKLEEFLTSYKSGAVVTITRQAMDPSTMSFRPVSDSSSLFPTKARIHYRFRLGTKINSKELELMNNLIATYQFNYPDTLGLVVFSIGDQKMVDDIENYKDELLLVKEAQLEDDDSFYKDQVDLINELKKRQSAGNQ